MFESTARMSATEDQGSISGQRLLKINIHIFPAFTFNLKESIGKIPQMHWTA